MARSLTNYLLFETIFDDINPTNRTVAAFARKILSPNIRISSSDCATKLGEVSRLDGRSVGKVSLFSYGTFQYDNGTAIITETILADDILTSEKVTALMTNQTKVATRSISTCTAPSGLCRKCIRGSFPELYEDLNDVPAVGESFQVNPTLKRPYLTYLTETHTGGLLGFKEIEHEPLPVREELVRSKISGGELAGVFRQVASLESVDQKFIQYARDMEDSLEKALFLILMYQFFINVKV